MIRPIVEVPKSSRVMERTSGRGEGLEYFADKLVAIFGYEITKWRVLDVGGGDGWLGEFLPSLEYHCLDPYIYPPLNRPQNHFHVQGVAERLLFKEDSFDLVVSKQTLVHFDDPAAAVREMLRVASRAVVIRQEFPESPIGWPGHSHVTIDGPDDVLVHLQRPGWTTRYDGVDFVARLEV